MMYLLEANLYLALFALSYYLLLRKQPFFVANRAILLLSILTALLLPLLPGNKGVQGTFISDAMAQIQLAPVVVGEASGINAPSSSGWLQWVAVVYLLGVIIAATRFIMRLVHTVKYIKAGRQRQMDGYTLVEMEDGKHAASFFHVLLWPSGPEDKFDKWMLIHEQVHIRERHSVDLILAEIVHIACWWNPAVLYLKRAIEHNNEYRADQVTVRAEKDAATTYSQVLVGKALGVSHTIFSHEFSKPNLLKMRLQMLQVTQNPTKRLRYLYLLPVLAIMLFVHACTETTPEPPHDENVQATLRALDSGEIELPAGITKEKFIEMIKNGEIRYDTEQPRTPSIGPDSIYTMVDVMPMFPGGQNALMAFLGDNIKYPASAKDDGIEGTVFITFVINKDGSLDQMGALRSPDERLTQAAIDAISAMPAWTPGEQNGTAVPVRYTLPVRFQLDS